MPFIFHLSSGYMLSNPTKLPSADPTKTPTTPSPTVSMTEEEEEAKSLIPITSSPTFAVSLLNPPPTPMVPNTTALVIAPGNIFAKSSKTESSKVSKSSKGNIFVKSSKAESRKAMKGAKTSKAGARAMKNHALASNSMVQLSDHYANSGHCGSFTIRLSILVAASVIHDHVVR